jgi:threonine dehydrogenase-like Zn-dependent dehydrogenase
MIRAAVLTAKETLQITEFPQVPPPRDGAVLRVTHCGVCGTDPHMYSGHLAVPMPLVMRHEFAGVLEGMGKDFPAIDVYGQALRPGDRVVVGTTLSCGRCYYCRFVPQRENLCENVDIYGITLGCGEQPYVRGGYADLTYLFPQTWLFSLPPNVTLRMAALCDPIACGTRVLERAFAPGMPGAGEGLGLGKSVVIQGLGPIGILTGAAAKAMGASPVIGIDTIALRIEAARRFGFDEVLSLADLPEPADQVRAVRGMTRGLGADVVVERAGTSGA